MVDGSFKYVTGIGKGYKNEKGVIGIQGTVQDITEKHSLNK
jgi:hypothetical protein